MKTSIIFLTLFTTIVVFVACGNGRGTDTDTDTTGIRASPGPTNGATGTRDERQDFVSDVIENYQRERTWLMAGINKGNDPDVKQLAGNLLSEHQKLVTALRNYANTQNLRISDTTTADVTRWVESAEREIIDITESGAEWDEEWADEIGDEYENVVRRLEIAQNNLQDDELRVIIERHLPIMRDYLERARRLESRLNRQGNR